MKILHIIDSLGLGGAQTVVKGIFENQKNNKNIFLYALRKREINIKIDHSNVKIFNSSKKYSLAPIKELRDLIKKENIEVLHCTLFRAQIFGYILKKFYFPNVKLIIHEQGQIFQNEWYYNRFMNLAQRRVDLYLAVSEATKIKLIDNAYVEDFKIKNLPNFVDLIQYSSKKRTLWRNRQRKKYHFKDNDFVFGFAGRFIQRKGWKEFIEAASETSKQQKKMFFLIAGDGPDKNKLIEMIKLSEATDNIKYMGYVKNMLEFYSLIDCFVLPSYWEGLSLAQLEVMAMGIPLITSNGLGLNEVPSENVDALFCEPKDAGNLARKMIHIYSNTTLRSKLSRNAQKKVKDYSLKAYISKLNNIYSNEI